MQIVSLCDTASLRTARFTGSLFFVLFFWNTAFQNEALAECGSVVADVPEVLFAAASGKISPYNTVKGVIGASRDLRFVVENKSASTAAAFSIIFYPIGGSRYHPTCTDIHSLPTESKIVIDVTEVPLGADYTFEIGSSSTSDLYYTALSDLDPDRTFPTIDVVRRNLYVFIFSNAPLAAQAVDHVNNAVFIWKKAGVDFHPIYRRFTGPQIASILGSDQALTIFHDDSDKGDGEWKDRKRVEDLKPSNDAFAVIFARTIFPNPSDPTADIGWLGTKTDYDRTQAYINGDVSGAPIGRTVAHEIGHLLLGEGHTGAGAPWSSGLMESGYKNGAANTSEDISDADAKTARNRAKKIPDK